MWEIDHRPCVVAGLCRSWRLGRSLQLYQHGFRCWGGDNTEAVGTNRETRWLFCLLSLSGILGFGVGFCGNEEDGWHSYPGGGEGDSLGSMLSSRWLRCVRPHGIRWMSSEVGTEGRREFVVRRDWSIDEVRAVYSQPLLELIYQGATAHRENFKADEVQQCTLLSVKTGGCPEDCKYCSQSSKYETAVKAEPLMQVEDVLQSARRARDAGSTRFCMGAAWRGVSQVGPRQFQRVLDMVKGVRSLGLEVCATLGMVDADQARRLKEAGLTAYNHNLDTSKEFYPKVITSRKYEDRLRTLQHVRDAGISVCCGGIIGLGETHEDRISLIHTLATLPEHPESVPVNALVANEGTPLEDQTPLPVSQNSANSSISNFHRPLSLLPPKYHVHRPPTFTEASVANGLLLDRADMKTVSHCGFF